MWREFKRQVFGGETETRKTRDGKTPLTSDDFMPVDEDDLEAMRQLAHAYGQLNSELEGE